MRWNEYERKFRLGFDNRISVEILRDGKEFLGLGQVKLGRRKLRCTELPVLPLIATPTGYEVARLEIEDIEKGEESIVLTLCPFMVPRGRMDWISCEGQDRWNVGAWAKEPVRDRGGMLQVTLRRVDRALGGIKLAGFSYQYRFHSRKYHVYRIHDRATWELGGWATGNSFWMRGPFNESHKAIRNKEDSFSTSWCSGEHQAGQRPQFLPLFSELQGFTFQFDRQNLLVTAFEEPFHCESLFQKESGKNYFTHWHQLCTDLQGLVEFPPLQVLCAELASENDFERANQYCAVREELYRQWRDKVGVTAPDSPVSGLLLGCKAGVKGVENGLDELAAAACERVFIPGLFRNHKPDDQTGLAEKKNEVAIQQIIEKAHARGLHVAVSLADCCSAWLLAGEEEETETKPEAEGYDQVLAALRDKRQWELLLKHLRGLKRDYGLDTLFTENAPPGLAEQFEWSGYPGGDRIARSSASIRSLEARRRELVVAAQEAGYECLLSGVCGFGKPGRPVPNGVIAGKEFMFRDCVFGVPEGEIIGHKAYPLRAYFRACANRLGYMPVYRAEEGLRGEMDPWWEEDFTSINRAYQAVREHMVHCRLLRGGRGVLWTGDEPGVCVLWCYGKFVWKVGAKAKVFEVTDGERVEIDEAAFTPHPLKVYLVQDAKEP